MHLCAGRSAAQKGILIGGDYLENVSKISAVAMSKTGMLAEGNKRVTYLFGVQPVIALVEYLFIEEEKSNILQ